MKFLLALVFLITTGATQAFVLKDAQTIGNVFGNKREIVRVIYDFSKDAGATGDYTMLTASNDVLVRMIGSKVITAAAGASATLDVGVGLTGQEYEAAGLVATYALNAFVGGDVAGFTKLSSGSILNLGVNTAALTAGKIEFIFEVVKF